GVCWRRRRRCARGRRRRCGVRAFCGVALAWLFAEEEDCEHHPDEKGDRDSQESRQAALARVTWPQRRQEKRREQRENDERQADQPEPHLVPGRERRDQHVAEITVLGKQNEGLGDRGLRPTLSKRFRAMRQRKAAINVCGRAEAQAAEFPRGEALRASRRVTRRQAFRSGEPKSS